MNSRSFLAKNYKLVHSTMLIRSSSDMFNLRIRVRSRKFANISKTAHPIPLESGEIVFLGHFYVGINSPLC